MEEGYLDRLRQSQDYSDKLKDAALRDSQMLRSITIANVLYPGPKTLEKEVDEPVTTP